jgi:hypothetical protein
MKKSYTLVMLKFGFIFLSLIVFRSLSNYQITTEEKYSSISKNIENHKLESKIIGLGGYQESCLEFDLKNMTPDTLFIKLEPGRRIVSVDSSFQDILIVKERRIILPPYKSMKFDGYGFCCRATKGSPRKDSEFQIGYMAPPEWIVLAEVINENKFPISAIQNAIWVVSDNHSIASIHHDKMEDIDLLRRTVAKIKGVVLPWYSITYEKDTARLFSNKPERIFGNFEYYINKNAMMLINVRSQKGKLMATLLKDKANNPGKHLFKLDLNVKNWPKGEYQIYVYEDYANLNMKLPFTLN